MPAQSLKMKKIILLLLFILGTFNLIFAQSKVKNVNASDFKVMLEKQKGILIDLRTPDEIQKGKIKGAIEIDFINADFVKEINKMDKNKFYYLYCASGGRSADAAEMMINEGFKHVVNLEKGFSDWKKQNFEIEKNK